MRWGSAGGHGHLLSFVFAEGWRVGADLGIFGFGAKVEKKTAKI